MRIRTATTALFGLLSVLGGCSSSTGPGNEKEFDTVPTSISIGKQPFELSALAITDSSGASLLRVGVLGNFPVAGVSVDRLWVLVGDRVWRTSVYQTPIPEDYYYWAVGGNSIEWDPVASFEVVAQLRHENGKRFFVRDDEVTIQRLRGGSGDYPEPTDP